jgi:DNA polymerase-3 subunit delta
MKIAYQQVEQHLSKKLAPIYLISGDELLLIQETVSLIREAARKTGFTERTSLSVEAGSDWSKQLHAEAHSLSLFATKRIVELHLAGTKPNVTTGKILKEIAANPIADTILIISTNKLDSKTEQTAWFKALDKAGVTITIWPIAIDQLPQWIMQRAKKTNLAMTADAAKRLAEQVEGNLLAAAQEIEKLGLLHLTGTIDVQAIEQTVTDNARFDIFTLVECALSGNSPRAIRILENLEAEDAEPLLVLWALTREVRTLAELAYQAKQGVALGSLFSKYRIWEKRQPAVRRFLQQHSVASCWNLLSQSAQIDRLIKGARPGNIWSELQQLTLRIAGTAIIKSSIPVS